MNNTDVTLNKLSYYCKWIELITLVKVGRNKYSGYAKQNILLLCVGRKVGSNAKFMMGIIIRF